MERPLVSQIYAYIVCLLAIVVALGSLAGFVNNAFRVAHPTMLPGMMVRHAGFGPFGHGMRTMPPPEAGAPNAGGATGPMMQIHQRFIADARYDAVRALVTHLVLLIAAVALFLWHWRWLHGRAATA
ncbi:MAG: hypothetical protein ACXWNK_08650 [Vulcanimicrobiaceae bacterium]